MRRARCSDLTLKNSVVLQSDAGYLQRKVALLVAADHGVAGKADERPVGAQAEAVLGPLQRAGLVDDSARQQNRFADDRRFVCWLDIEALLIAW